MPGEPPVRVAAAAAGDTGHLLFSGFDFVFSSPEAREKSEELKRRLRKLEELAEKKAYAELVKDITPKEIAEPFSSCRYRVGFESC